MLTVSLTVKYPLFLWTPSLSLPPNKHHNRKKTILADKHLCKVVILTYKTVRYSAFNQLMSNHSKPEKNHLCVGRVCGLIVAEGAGVFLSAIDGF